MNDEGSDKKALKMMRVQEGGIEDDEGSGKMGLKMMRVLVRRV
jgi:hypothetical protein